MLKSNCISLNKLHKHKTNYSIDLRNSRQIPNKEMSISNDLLSLTHFNNSSCKIRSSKGIISNSVNSSYHPRENSLSTTHGQKAFSPAVFNPINQKRNNTLPSLLKKEGNVCQDKNEELDFVYKKMFLFSIRKHKFKEKFHYNNLDNFNTKSKYVKTEKNKGKENDIGSKINDVNQKLGFIKGIVDYCYPSQFLLKIKETKKYLNKAYKDIPTYYCSENNIQNVNNIKEKHYQVLAKSIKIKSVSIRQMTDSNNNNVL